MTTRTSSARIVVGVDGSAGARAALRWALDEASIRGAQVEAVHAWHFPVPVGLPYADLQAVATVDLEAAARAALAVDVEAAKVEFPGALVEQRVVAGPASEVLLAVAKGADLLVVGSRGRGGFAGLLLGSVSRQCAEHSPCPVVVVRESS